MPLCLWALTCKQFLLLIWHVTSVIFSIIVFYLSILLSAWNEFVGPLVPSFFLNSSTSRVNEGLVYFRGVMSPSIHRLVHLMDNQLILFVVLS